MKFVIERTDGTRDEMDDHPAPLREDVDNARLIAKEAEEAWLACAHYPDAPCEHSAASNAADAELERALAALHDSDEPRAWVLTEEGVDYETIQASSAEEALEVARGNVSEDNYDLDPDGEGSTTIWIAVRVHCPETGEEESDRVQLDPPEPPCDDAPSHDWRSPHEIVGGIKENPGVHGHGGGVIIDEVCMQCGLHRKTDTWAQDVNTGEQGLESMSYQDDIREDFDVVVTQWAREDADEYPGKWDPQSNWDGEAWGIRSSNVPRRLQDDLWTVYRRALEEAVRAR